MELLILKSGEKYIRVKDDTYLLVNLDKASVFPMDRLDTVLEHEERLSASGYEQVSLKKLVLTEEDFQP